MNGDGGHNDGYHAVPASELGRSEPDNGRLSPTSHRERHQIDHQDGETATGSSGRKRRPTYPEIEQRIFTMRLQDMSDREIYTKLMTHIGRRKLDEVFFARIEEFEGQFRWRAFRRHHLDGSSFDDEDPVREEFRGLLEQMSISPHSEDAEIQKAMLLMLREQERSPRPGEIMNALNERDIGDDRAVKAWRHLHAPGGGRYPLRSVRVAENCLRRLDLFWPEREYDLLSELCDTYGIDTPEAQETLELLRREGIIEPRVAYEAEEDDGPVVYYLWADGEWPPGYFEGEEACPEDEACRKLEKLHLAVQPPFREYAKPWPALNDQDRLKVVRDYLKLGWSVVPVRADNAPSFSGWARYQKKRPSLEDWQEWLEGKPSNGVRPVGEIAGLSVICGEVSGNLVVLDLHRGEVWRKFADQNRKTATECRVVNAGGRRHVYVQLDDGSVPSRKLDGIDVLGRGELVLLPPSPHPSGGMYYDMNRLWDMAKATRECLLEVLQPYEPESARDTQREEPAAVFAPIVELLRPYDRDALSEPLAGLLANKRWSLELAEGLFNALVGATGDEEGRSRLTDLRGTYDRLERGDSVQGYTGLEEILQPDDLAQLTKAVAKVRRDTFDMEAELAGFEELDGAEQDRAIVDLVSWAATNLRGPEIELLGRRMKGMFKLADYRFQRIVKSAKEEAQREQIEEATDRRVEIAEEYREKALGFLRRPDLLWVVARNCEKFGVAGERRNVCVLYLVLTSRLLDRPISITIKGESSAGKSYVLSRVLWLFPKEAYWELTGMSQQALIYTKQSFAHRTIIIMERPGMGKADYNIRTLQSEGKVAFETVGKGPHGALVPITIEKEGPTNFVSTTTEAVGDVQNETRHWTLTADESPEQTARILQMEGKRLRHRVPAGPQVVDLAAAHAIQYLLKPKPVIVPYGSWLADRMPREPHRIRRDFPRLGAAIEAMALLHQYRRDEDKKGRLVATVADYAMVRALLAETFVSSLRNMNPNTLKLVDVAKEIYEEKSGEAGSLPPVYVTVNEIQRRTMKASNTITNWLKPAIVAGYLQNIADGAQGKAWKLVPGEPKGVGETILPTVDDLGQAFPKLVRPWFDPLTGEEH